MQFILDIVNLEHAHSAGTPAYPLPCNITMILVSNQNAYTCQLMISLGACRASLVFPEQSILLVACRYMPSSFVVTYIGDLSC